MVVHKRLLIQPCTYHKLECGFRCSLLLFLTLVLNLYEHGYEYESIFDIFLLIQIWAPDHGPFFSSIFNSLIERYIGHFSTLSGVGGRLNSMSAF